jgi:GNAT superfamily N-acetyltransferase
MNGGPRPEQAAGRNAKDAVVDIALLSREEDLHDAAAVSAVSHARLRSALPFLPARDDERFYWKVKWMAEHGIVLGLRRNGRLASFLGGFLIENFRNAGPGCFSPEWSNGALDQETAFSDYRALYREIASEWIRMGARLHALSVYSSEANALEALSLTGFGRITLDAARPTGEIAALLDGRAASAGIVFRRAVSSDARSLGGLAAGLAAHIGASPVLMPDTRGPDADEWRSWLGEPDAVAIVAENNNGLVGFIKAQDPQFDVSDAVHAEGCLAINGMYCLPELRGRGIGTALFAALALHARKDGKPLMSVDCETTNPEAYGFWPRFFAPVSWSLERRL